MGSDDSSSPSSDEPAPRVFRPSADGGQVSAGGLPAPRGDVDVVNHRDSLDAASWDAVGQSWIAERPQRLWREFTDRLQTALIDRWLDSPLTLRPGSPAAALKTDLFDEVAGRGVASHLLVRGYETTGIDISGVVVAEAHRRNPLIQALVADVRSLPFADASFDVAFSGSTLDHFAVQADIGRALKEITRVLRPGGRLLLTLDNPYHPLVRLRRGVLLRLLRRSGIVPYDVGATLSPPALATLVRSCGLDIRHTTAILHCPRVVAVAAARFFEQSGVASQERLLAAMAAWERLERWPSRYVTGHFTAILAQRPLAGEPISTGG